MKYTMKDGPRAGESLELEEGVYLVWFDEPPGYYIKPPGSEEFESVSEQLAGEYHRMKADEEEREKWLTLRALGGRIYEDD